MQLLIALLLCFAFCFSATAQEAPHNDIPYEQWLDAFKQEALGNGISQQTLNDAFQNSGAPDEQVVTLDRKQPEGHLTLAQYLHNTVTQDRITRGRELLAENHDLLARISQKYDVQPEFILALWAVETNFGDNTGVFSVVDSLATLAYDGRRSAYFRDELMKALKIIDTEHIPASSMIGSWAGAMGQCQFMPTSFLEYAVDFDGDGMRDIWDTQADVFASIANYLHSSGWKGSESWGGEASVPQTFDMTLADIKQTKSWSQWHRLGVSSGAGFTPDTDSSLILVGEGDDAATYIVGGNYKVLLKWNRSRFFATAVSTLADAIHQGE